MMARIHKPVTPAQAGVQMTSDERTTAHGWAPACAGATENALKQRSDSATENARG
jgi:hypothetical protein